MMVQNGRHGWGRGTLEEASCKPRDIPTVRPTNVYVYIYMYTYKLFDLKKACFLVLSHLFPQ